jgi:hypothetical protein
MAIWTGRTAFVWVIPPNPNLNPNLLRATEIKIRIKIMSRKSKPKKRCTAGWFVDDNRVKIRA